MLYSIYNGKGRWIAIMIDRPKYFFNRELKDEFLQGMKLNYLCEQVGISYSYLTSIIQGQNAVDKYLIENIMTCIGYNTRDIKDFKDKYFTLRD